MARSFADLLASAEKVSASNKALRAAVDAGMHVGRPVTEALNKLNAAIAAHDALLAAELKDRPAEAEEPETA
jgi:hypothetical protein